MTNKIYKVGNGEHGASGLPEGWDPLRYLLYNAPAREAGAFTPDAALDHFRVHGGPFRFEATALPNKNHVVTLMGYTAIKPDGNRHTNWFPWNRFLDVYRQIGYRAEWLEMSELERQGEKRIFITWNEPTALELFNSSKIYPGDIVLQKVTSLGKGMESVNWTVDAAAWIQNWEWPIYRTIEYLADMGCAVHAFGCRTASGLAPEKDRIVERLGERMHWIPWGGTPFDWANVLAAAPVMSGFKRDAVFVGSKWGRIGRGNIDAWKRYLEPLEASDEISFEKVGGIGQKMVTDDEMVAILRTGKTCPIVHAPSWQAERGVQDRFYTVFLSGRFGVCDNLGAIDVFGDEIAEICDPLPASYYEKTLYFSKALEAQLPYVKFIQDLIKKHNNFYVSWYDLLSSLPEMTGEH